MFPAKSTIKTITCLIAGVVLSGCASGWHTSPLVEMSPPSREVLETACYLAYATEALRRGEVGYFDLQTAKVATFLGLQLVTVTRDLGPADFEFEAEWYRRYAEHQEDLREVDLDAVSACRLKSVKDAGQLEPSSTVIWASSLVANPYVENPLVKHGFFVQIRSFGGAGSTYWLPVRAKEGHLVPVATIKLDVYD